MGGGWPGITTKSTIASIQDNDEMFRQLHGPTRSAAACRDHIFPLQPTSNLKNHSERQTNTRHHWGIELCCILSSAMVTSP